MSPPTTADEPYRGKHCPTCHAQQWDFYRGRARCRICGHIARWKSIELPQQGGRRSYTARQLRKDSDRSEQAHAARVGGRTTRGSGSGHDKGDVRTQTELHELKETSARSRSLKLDEWEKIQTQALSQGLRPALVITFIQPAKRTTLVVLDINDYEALKEAADAATDDR